MTQSELASALRAAVEEGDAERARDLVVRASEKDRRAAVSQLGDRLMSDRWTWEKDRQRNRIAALVAWLGTATARQIATESWLLQRDPGDRGVLALVYDVLAARGASFVETIARNTVDAGVQRMWPVLRLAVANGLIRRPEDGDAYVRGMVVSLGWTGTDAEATYRALLDDAELLDTEVWQIFEIDCATELSNANVWETGKHGQVVRGGKRDNRWQRALVQLVQDGRLDRQRVLDASLDALQRDFRPSMVGWYAKLHEALAPSPDERRSRIDTYLTLVASPVPAVLKEGLTGLRAVEDAVPADDLVRVAAGPLSQKQKNLAVDMLRLLERKATREPEERSALLEAAALGLGHERADVQERALAVLERFPDEAPRATLLGLTDVVAAPLRARTRALTGIADEPARASQRQPSVVTAFPARPVTVDVFRSTARPLEAVASVDELIELAAYLLEGQGTGDDVERLLDGVSRLCDQRPEGFERRTAGLRARVEGAGWWQFGSSAGDAVTFVVDAWVTGRRVRGLKPARTMLGLLAERALEVGARAARRSARPLLAFPTHEGGWIDPAVLAERERRVGRLLNRPGSADLLQARVRALVSPEPIRYERRIVESRWSPDVRHVELHPDRLTPGLGQLAERVEAVGRIDRPVWVNAAPWGSWDALGTRWCLTAIPAHPEIAFAGTAILIAGSLDSNPQLHPEPALELALVPGVPLGETAWLAIAAALVAKSPDLRRAATDVLVSSMSDGRFDPGAAADALAWYVDGGLAKISRLEGPLRDAGRVSELHAVGVVRLVEAVLASLRATPHGLHAALEVAVEHSASSGAGIERTESRAALERIAAEVSAGSKLGRLARGLLDVEGAAA